MDTVQIRITDAEATKYLKKALPTQIHLEPPRYFIDRPIPYRDDKTSIGNRNALDRHYRDSYCGLFQDRWIFIGWKRLKYQKDNRNVTAIFHASQFNTWTEVLHWMSELFGDHFPSVFKSKITRIDCCVDIDVSWDTLSTMIVRDKVRNVSQWKSESRTLYLGSRPVNSVIYEKKVSQEKIDLNFNSSAKSRNGTRVEACRVNKRLDINYLYDVPLVAKTNPFENVKLFRTQFLSVDACPSNKMKMLGFMTRVKQVGLAAAKLEVGSKNFKRDFGPYLVDANDLNLKNAWENRCERFFGFSTKTLVAP